VFGNVGPSVGELGPMSDTSIVSGVICCRSCNEDLIDHHAKRSELSAPWGTKTVAATNRARRGRPPRVVRYAVIGLGHIAQAAMLPAFAHARGNSRLTALISGSLKKLKTLGNRYGVDRLLGYADAEEFFASGEIDAVYIAMPNEKHKEWAVRAARAGLHVLCEKPMAVTRRECEAMIRAAAAAQVKLMIAYRLHFEAANLFAQEQAHRGALGDLRFFSSDFSMQVRDHNIRLRGGKGGGPLYDIGIYCLNAARASFRETPRAVLATATRSRDPRFRQIEESVSVVMRYSDEKLATFNCSFGGADRATYTITGTRGSVTLDPAYEYVEPITSLVRLGSKQRTRHFAKRDQFAAELVYFSDCVLNNRAPEPDGQEGRIDIEIIEALHRSIDTGRWVKIPRSHRTRRPARGQEIRRPPVPREPELVDVRPASR
jgi:predicted dehydrogenase